MANILRRLAVAAAVILCAATLQAQNYIQHVVRRGESLETIANHYNVTPQAIRDANPGLTAIYVGYRLNIPSAAAGMPTAQTPQPAASPQTAAEMPQGSYSPQQPAGERLVRDSGWWNQRRTPRNLYLAVNHNNGIYYFSPDDYGSLTEGQKNGLSKVGVVVVGNDESGRTQRFILALNDLTGDKMTWTDAVAAYGSYLPSKEQGYVWALEGPAVKECVMDYGGGWPKDSYLRYWTGTECGTVDAWCVYTYSGFLIYNIKTSEHRVRAVVTIK